MRLYAIKGMVLFFTLLFIHILALLGLLFLQETKLALKTAASTRASFASNMQAPAILAILEQTILRECVIPLQTDGLIVNKDAAWWTQFGCQGMIEQVFYEVVYERLGDMDCAPDNNAGVYWRVNVNLSAENYIQREILQTTLLKIDNAEAMCKGKKVVSQRLSWLRF
jgi:hypothetical protein